MKMKKIVALVTASALCLGMSMTALAAEGNPSPGWEDLIGPDGSLDSFITAVDNDNGWYVSFDKDQLSITSSYTDLEAKHMDEANLQEIATKHGLDLTKDRAIVEEFARRDAEEEYNNVVNTLWNSREGSNSMLAAFANNEYQNYTVPAKTKATVLYTVNLNPVDADGNPLTGAALEDAKELEWTFNLDQYVDLYNLKPNQPLYILHYTDNGWEPMKTELLYENGQFCIRVKFENGFSPIGIINLTSTDTGEPVDLELAGIGDGDGDNDPDNQPGSDNQPGNDANNGSSNGSSSNGSSSNGSSSNGTVKNPTTTVTKTGVVRYGTSPKTGEF